LRVLHKYYIFATVVERVHQKNWFVKKLSILILLFILASLSGVKAQLYFCGNYTDAGDPLEVSDRFNLGENGGYVYMLYSNKKKVIRAKFLNVVITKLANKNYLPYDKKIMEVQEKKNWAIIDYHFIQGGDYKVSIEESNGHELSKNFISVALKNINSLLAPDQSPDEKYYNATLIFCKDVVSTQPVEVSHNFTTGDVYLFLQNDKPLASDSMTVKYFRLPPGADAYEPYNVVRYGISGSLSITYFSCDFEEPGEYRVEIYNNKYAKMAIGHVTIASGTKNYKKDPDESYYKSKLTFYKTKDNGEFKDEATSFKIGQVYIYFTNDRIFFTDSISVMVYKKSAGSDTYDKYVDFKKYGIQSKEKATWFTWNFLDTGDYSVEIYNKGFSKMGVGYVTITGLDIKDPEKSYYNAKTVFCQNIVDGYEVKPGVKFKAGEVYVVVRNDKSLATDSIIVDVHKKAYDSQLFNIYVMSQNYGIPPGASATYFSLDFKENGQYKVEIFNRKQQKISEGIVTIR
jgi:uncharacterized integral membrane protein